MPYPDDPNVGAQLAHLTPYRRFSVLVALVVAVGSIVISLAIAQVIERYVADETASQTARELEDHYTVIFGSTVFERPLSADEQTRFHRSVRFHLDVYDIVQVRMYRPDGTIVYSYDPAVIGASAFDLLGAERARAAARGEHSYEVGLDGMRLLIPVVREGHVVGVAEVVRDVQRLFGAVRRMQLLVTGVVLLGAIGLFLSLRRIYADSTRLLRQREESEHSARAQVAAAQELARLKGEFVSQVTHELRNPLAPIAGYAEMLVERADSPEEVRRYAQAIARQAGVLERLVDDLLDLARLETGRYRLARQPTRIEEVLAAAADELSGTSALHPIAVEVTPDLPPVDADPDRVAQVVRNLIANAIRYSPTGGEVRVRAMRDGEEVAIAVVDRGIGIPPDRLERIFEKFYRVDNELTRKVEGTGLGLAISRELVEAHGGRIWAESAPGRGSTFYFTLAAAA
jgi:signal transduction histidine kinase